jgi:hypothetical protein
MSDKSRRKLLKSITAGSGAFVAGQWKLLKSITAGSGAFVAGQSLPGSWVRPVVNSVLLPSHALTSPGPGAGVVALTVTFDV